LAVTDFAPFMLKVQLLLPWQSPVQPANRLPAAGLACKTTLAPAEKLAEHVPVQLIPAGLLVTVPEPPPVLLTVNG
jgi:hypothetical protein